ncbi:hypothetical protein [Bradyrhizobium sp. WSM1417]|uniref:hypothetical protein n=1 Tax=Bradyrhizobium sp. WSM1417 TaxID=754500 RepID=UPI000488C8AC|nr:hypothetical protein [Bradyrhizobium sp. WSM1417]
MPTKTYLVYCQFDNPSNTEPLHYHFEYLIQAHSADDAEAKCKERFAALPTDGDKLFEIGSKIYVDYIIEIGGVPEEGVLLRWVRYRGARNPIGFSSLSSALPFGDGGGMLASYTTDDPDKEESEMQPFVVIGA